MSALGVVVMLFAVGEVHLLQVHAAVVSEPAPATTAEELVMEANNFLQVGAPDAAVERFQKALRLNPRSNDATLGLMKAKHLATILPNAITAGEVQPVDWTPVHRAIEALKAGTVRVHNPSFKVHNEIEESAYHVL